MVLPRTVFRFQQYLWTSGLKGFGGRNLQPSGRSKARLADLGRTGKPQNLYDAGVPSGFSRF